MFDSVGVAASSGVVCGMIAAVSIIPTVVLQGFGRRWRKEREEIAF